MKLSNIVGYQKTKKQKDVTRARRLLKQFKGKEAKLTEKDMVKARGYEKTCALVLRGLEATS